MFFLQYPGMVRRKPFLWAVVRVEVFFFSMTSHNIISVFWVSMLLACCLHMGLSHAPLRPFCTISWPGGFAAVILCWSWGDHNTPLVHKTEGCIIYKNRSDEIASIPLSPVLRSYSIANFVICSSCQCLSWFSDAFHEPGQLNPSGGKRRSRETWR